METVFLVIHILLALVLVGTVLLQRSEGGVLSGLGGGGGGGFGLMSGRGAAGFLTRMTAVLAICFMATSIVLAVLAGSANRSGVVPAPVETQTPAIPSVPPAQ